MGVIFGERLFDLGQPHCEDPFFFLIKYIFSIDPLSKVILHRIKNSLCSYSTLVFIKCSNISFHVQQLFIEHIFQSLFITEVKNRNSFGRLPYARINAVQDLLYHVKSNLFRIITFDLGSAIIMAILQMRHRNIKYPVQS